MAVSDSADGRELLEQYWITRDESRERYHKAKSAAVKCRSFYAQQTGWKLIVNDRLVKLEKLPAHAEPFMGIETFTEVRDYCLLCALLIYLEDKEDDEQFLLSELVDMMGAQLSQAMPVDWTSFSQRKSLIRVLHFAEERRLLKVYDGSSDSLTGGIQEILYENTGLSRYFAVNYPYSIEDRKCWQDFEQSGTGMQVSEDSDRGAARINRVYRRLTLTPAVYWSCAEDADAQYIRNQRQWIARYLDEYLGARLDVHKNAAFCVLEEGDTFGQIHPRDAVISETALQICGLIREKVSDGSLMCEKDDTITLDRSQWEELVLTCRERYSEAWGKEFRQMAPAKLIDTMTQYMASWMLIDTDAQNSKIIVRSGTGKMTGSYPRDYKTREDKQA